MKISKYPDGTSYVDISRLDTNKVSTFRVNTYEDLWHLRQYVDACNNIGETPTVLIPSLIDAQADRRFDDGQSSGLKLVCNFLNSMDAKFKIFHPHNPEVVEALMDNVEILDNSQFVTKAIVSIDRTYAHTNKNPENNLILMSSDAGGFKPLIKLCNKIEWKGETYSAAKSRHPVKHSLTQIVDREDFEGKDILIVDDISVFGGTFKGLAKILKDKNCGNIYLAVSHITMQDLGKHPVTDFYSRVFTTNSKYDNYYAPDGQGGTQPNNIEIIKLF